MRLVRLGPQPSTVGADVREALTEFGVGDQTLGGVALVGATPSDATDPVDAIIVLPRGVILVVGVDLPEPAQRLEAPLRTPWTVDSWPMVRTEGAVNPAIEAQESASSLAKTLQFHDVEPLPVSTIIAVGPSVDQVTQSTTDLQQGVRVVPPSTSSILAAARELATYPRRCPLEPARRLLKVLAPQEAELASSELTAEGFPVFADADPAAAETVQFSRIEDVPEEAAATPAIRLPMPDLPRRRDVLLAYTAKAARQLAAAVEAQSRRTKLIALSVIAAAACAIVVLMALSAGTKTVAAMPDAPPIRVDGVDFVRRLTQHDTNCAQHSLGDVQAWFHRQPCAGLTRADFSTTVVGRSAAVSEAVVDLGDPTAAANLRDELNTTGTGGIADLVTEGHGWANAPSSWDGSAQAVEQDGNHVRIVQTVWTQGQSQPADIELRALAERGLRLPAAG